MIRYDQVDIKKVEVDEEIVIKEHVQIDSKHMLIIKNLFTESLKKLAINNVPLIDRVTKNIIVLNKNITLQMLSKTLGKELRSKTEFVKEFYMYGLDDLIDEAYGKKVIAIQEFPYSFNSTQDENVVSYEFIV